jgi:hypothetical protein
MHSWEFDFLILECDLKTLEWSEMHVISRSYMDVYDLVSSLKGNILQKSFRLACICALAG